MTNYDRIKAMSVEEMAVMFADEIPHGDCYGCDKCDGYHSPYIERLEEQIVEVSKTIKSEAVKEFAERLKNKIEIDLSCGVDSAYYLDDVLFNDIDNLAKEMVGTKNEN